MTGAPPARRDASEGRALPFSARLSFVLLTHTTERYTNGECHLLALALNALTGWPIVALVETDPKKHRGSLTELVSDSPHFMVRTPSGYFDIEGERETPPLEQYQAVAAVEVTRHMVEYGIKWPMEGKAEAMDAALLVLDAYNRGGAIAGARSASGERGAE